MQINKLGNNRESPVTSSPCRSQNKAMVPLGHTWTPLHNPGHVPVLLLIRRPQIHEGPQALPAEECPHLVQCNSSDSQRNPGVGGPRGWLEERLQLPMSTRGLHRQPSGDAGKEKMRGSLCDPHYSIDLILCYAFLPHRWPVLCGCTTCAKSSNSWTRSFSCCVRTSARSPSCTSTTTR